MRFIEVMPLTGVADVASDGVVKTEELIAQLAIHGRLDDPPRANRLSARRYRIPARRASWALSAR